MNEVKFKSAEKKQDENFVYAQAQENNQKDKFTIRVKSGGDPNNPNNKPTNPKGLARSVLHVLKQFDSETKEGGYVRVLSVGSPSLTIVMEAFRLASQEVESRTNGSVLVLRQSEYTANIGGKKARGICTRIFGIPIKYAV